MKYVFHNTNNVFHTSISEIRTTQSFRNWILRSKGIKSDMKLVIIITVQNSNTEYPNTYEYIRVPML